MTWHDMGSLEGKKTNICPCIWNVNCIMCGHDVRTVWHGSFEWVSYEVSKLLLITHTSFDGLKMHKELCCTQRFHFGIPHRSEILSYNFSKLEVSCTTTYSQLSFHYQLFWVKLPELGDLESCQLSTSVTMPPSCASLLYTEWRSVDSNRCYK